MVRVLGMVVAVAASFCCGQAAQATVINFGAEGAANERVLPIPTRETLNGYVLNFVGTGNSTFAGPVNGNPTGWGACSVIGADGLCADMSDEAVNGNESIQLLFIRDSGFGARTVDLGGWSFVDENGLSLDDTQSSLSFQLIDQNFVFTPRTVTTFSDLVSLAIAGQITDIIGFHLFAEGTPFFLQTLTIDDGISEVPAPAALPLFLAGLAGIGFSEFRNRRQKSSV